MSAELWSVPMDGILTAFGLLVGAALCFSTALAIFARRWWP